MGVETALFFVVPHFLAANRIHFAEKCSKRRADVP